jgi:hypothetical protein
MKRILFVGAMAVMLVFVLTAAMEASTAPLAAESEADAFAALVDDSQLAPLAPTQLGTVTMRITPSPYTATLGEIFTVDVEVEAGANEVQGVKMYLDFDTSKLEVVDAAGDPTDELIDGDLDFAAKNEVDNATGQIAYDTAMLGDRIDGTFRVATIRFKALELGTADVTINLTDPRKTRVSYAAGQDHNLVASDGVVIIVPPVGEVILTPESQILAAGHTATLTATVTDGSGDPWAGDVMFSASAGCIDSPVSTVDGVAVTSFDCVTQVQTVLITATADSVMDTAEVVVEPDRENPVSVTISPSEATLTAGECVTFTLMAEDAYGNTFDVTADATFTTTGGGTLTHNVYCAETAGTWTVTGEYKDKSDDATVIVQAGTDITRLEFGHIDDQLVNVSFTIVITAYNGYGNVARYDGTGVLSDTTGTLTPTVANFTNGLAELDVTITTWQDDVVITVTADDKSGDSNEFDVKPRQILFPIVSKDFSIYERYKILMPSVFKNHTE